MGMIEMRHLLLGAPLWACWLVLQAGCVGESGAAIPKVRNDTVERAVRNVMSRNAYRYAQDWPGAPQNRRRASVELTEVDGVRGVTTRIEQKTPGMVEAGQPANFTLHDSGDKPVRTPEHWIRQGLFPDPYWSLNLILETHQAFTPLMSEMIDGKERSWWFAEIPYMGQEERASAWEKVVREGEGLGRSSQVRLVPEKSHLSVMIGIAGGLVVEYQIAEQVFWEDETGKPVGPEFFWSKMMLDRRKGVTRGGSSQEVPNFNVRLIQTEGE